MPDQDESNACFVVSPIGEAGTPGHKRAKNVLEYIIRPAAEAVGLKAVRADDLSQPGSITTQVIQQLISVKAVVADLTDLNPNVFYELAVRDSFGAPVVLIAEDGTKLPFDLIQQRTIFFDSSDLASAIPARGAIERALRESLVNPSAGSPVTAAVDLNALRSGDPEARQVAELSSQVERMRRELAALRRDSVRREPARPVTYLPDAAAIDWDTVTTETIDALPEEILVRLALDEREQSRDPELTAWARLEARKVLTQRGFVFRET